MTWRCEHVNVEHIFLYVKHPLIQTNKHVATTMPMNMLTKYNHDHKFYHFINDFKVPLPKHYIFKCFQYIYAWLMCACEPIKYVQWYQNHDYDVCAMMYDTEFML